MLIAISNEVLVPRLLPAEPRYRMDYGYGQPGHFEGQVVQNTERISQQDKTAAIEDGVASMEEDVAVVEEDLAALKDDIAAIEEDAPVVDEDIAAVKEDIAALREDIAVVEGDVAAVEDIAASQDPVVPAEDELAFVEEDIAAIEEATAEPGEKIVLADNDPVDQAAVEEIIHDFAPEDTEIVEEFPNINDSNFHIAEGTEGLVEAARGDSGAPSLHHGGQVPEIEHPHQEKQMEGMPEPGNFGHLQFNNEINPHNRLTDPVPE